MKLCKCFLYIQKVLGPNASSSTGCTTITGSNDSTGSTCSSSSSSSLTRVALTALVAQIVFVALESWLRQGNSPSTCQESDRIKTTFVTHCGKHQYRYLFGLWNVETTFQQLMDVVLYATDQCGTKKGHQCMASSKSGNGEESPTILSQVYLFKW